VFFKGDGYSYIELSNYMEKIGFKKVEDPDDFKENRFYFRWSANNFDNVEVGVFGHYSDQLKIIEINVIPKI
jgi:hypothetical protein